MDALLDVADYLCYEEMVACIWSERKEVLKYEEKVSKLEEEHQEEVGKLIKWLINTTLFLQDVTRKMVLLQYVTHLYAVESL